MYNPITGYNTQSKHMKMALTHLYIKAPSERNQPLSYMLALFGPIREFMFELYLASYWKAFWWCIASLLHLENVVLAKCGSKIKQLVHFGPLWSLGTTRRVFVRISNTLLVTDFHINVHFCINMSTYPFFSVHFKNFFTCEKV